MERLEKPSRQLQQVPAVVEHLFRHEAGRLVAALTRIFGIEHLALAEDVVQEALSRALQTWPFYGIPEKPAAWIMRTARNLALDVVRREKSFREKEPEIIREIERENGGGEIKPAEGEIGDDRLRMMFVCCHPRIAPESQVALALKTLCGFGVKEIARAFIVSEAAIAKRLARAKQEIRVARIPFEIPAEPELAGRLEGVLQSLYLLFNEGYKASTGEKLVREDVCAEAIRLARLLAENPLGNQPQTHALLALMLLNAARFPARVDAEGNLLRLPDQDRSLWDREMIAEGLFHLAESAAGKRLTPYHLQAAIAACHCSAADYPSTDWPQILALYDRLAALDGSPVVALNRAVALAEVRGPAAGIEAVEGIRGLDGYYLRDAVLGEFAWRLEDFQDARAHFEKALSLADIESERMFLARRAQECGHEIERGAGTPL